jgi:hypothetical protein
VIDQNTAWAKAIPMRLITSTSKFQAKRQHVAGDKQNKQADQQARRSILLVSSINGSDISATTQA